MRSLKAKIVSAEVGADGRATITVDLVENGLLWQKTYEYYTTEPIKLADFQKRVTEEIKADLAVVDNKLKEIRPVIGKEFTITV
jgi:glutathione S-transferase